MVLSLEYLITAKDQASRNLKKVDGSIKQIDKTMSKSLQTAGKWGAGIALGAGLAVKSWLNAAGDFEQTQIAFTTMLGSAEAAQKKLNELAEFAARTPFTLTGVENSARLLMAMGIETEKLIPTLKALGDVSAGLSVDLERVALNYGQVATQGKLTGVELKDFLRAGVPLLAELAKNLDETESNIKEMVSAGKIGFPAVEEAFRTMTSEGGKFSNLMEEQSKSLKGQLSNIEDSFELLSREMGQTLLPVAKQLAGALQKLVQWFADLSPETKKMITTITLAAGAMGALLAVVGLVAAAIPAVISGVAGLTVIMAALASPIGLVVIALGALAAALFAVEQQRRILRQGFQDDIQFNNEVAESYRNLADAVGKFAESSEKLAEGRDLANEVNELLAKRIKLEDDLMARMINPFQAEQRKQIKQQIADINKLIEAKGKESRDTIRLGAEMADARAKMNGEIFRNDTKWAALRMKLTEEEFQAAEAMLYHRGGVTDEVNRAILNGEIVLTKEKINLINILDKANVSSANAVIKLSVDEANERLGIAKKYALGEAALIQQLLDHNADAGNEELNLFAKKLTREQNLSVQFKNDLAAIFNEPIIQQIQAVFGDEDTPAFTKINNAIGLLKSKFKNSGAVLKKYRADISAVNLEFDASVEKIKATETALGDLGGGGGGSIENAAEELEKLQDELAGTADSYQTLNERAGQDMADLTAKHVESIERMNSKTMELKGSLEELQTAYDIQVQGFDTTLGARVVQQEQLIADLKNQILGETDEGNATDLLARLGIEESALKAFMRNSIGLEEEIEEARRRVSLTDFERFTEDIANKRALAKTEFEDRQTQLQEELAIIEEQKTAEIAAFQEKINEYANLTLAFQDYETKLREGMINSANITREKVDEMIEALLELEGMLNRTGVTSVGSLTGATEPVSGGGAAVGSGVIAGAIVTFGDINIGSEVDAEAFLNEMEERLRRTIQLQQVNSTP